MWIQYTSNNNSKFYLVLPINSTEDKMMVLLSDKIDSKDAENIRSNMTELDNLPIDKRILWFRSNIKSYNSAYREFKRSQMKIERSFELK